MFGKLRRTIKEKERAFRTSFGRDITDPHERRKSRWHFNWLDHGILRIFWHNFAEIGPGVYRSNHPNERRFKTYADMGIKSILNLRGNSKQSHYLFEVESCAAHGLRLVNFGLSARRAPPAEMLLQILEVFESIEKPFLMHCKSGADRTGLIAALYLMAVDNQPIDVARKQLSFRFLHIRRTSTGILDHFLDVYEARNVQTPIAIADWIRLEYDPDALSQSFAEKQASLRFWQGWR
ncbi:tyrosine-protein phosphatase [Yoonia sp.]|uniref:phosphatase domain-containing putative toxin n=1 Tax=Yoonia sp. TaxID=2212373 RepID=UPI0023B40DEB